MHNVQSNDPKHYKCQSFFLVHPPTQSPLVPLSPNQPYNWTSFIVKVREMNFIGKIRRINIYPYDDRVVNLNRECTS
jgi:hypothetical protein